MASLELLGQAYLSVMEEEMTAMSSRRLLMVALCMSMRLSQSFSLRILSSLRLWLRTSRLAICWRSSAWSFSFCLSSKISLVNNEEDYVDQKMN